MLTLAETPARDLEVRNRHLKTPGVSKTEVQIRLVLEVNSLRVVVDHKIPLSTASARLGRSHFTNDGRTGCQIFRDDYGRHDTKYVRSGRGLLVWHCGTLQTSKFG